MFLFSIRQRVIELQTLHAAVQVQLQTHLCIWHKIYFNFYHQFLSRMGNCSNEFMDAKHSAAQNLETLFEDRDQSTPIAFAIKEWPDRNSVDLRAGSEAVTRNLDLNLYPGEKIQITLKNHQRPGREGEEGHSPSQVLSKNGLHCEIRRNSQFYQFDFPLEHECQALWRYTHGWTHFAEGDVLRMGVTKYRLSKLAVEREGGDLRDLQRELRLKASSIEESAPRCRICLSTVDSPEDPFISPCKCDGSIKFTHLRCLSAWLFSSSVNENELLTIRSNLSVCELCKTDITGTAEFAQMEGLLLNHLHDVPAPYAIFECYHLREEHRAAKDYFVLSFAHKHNYTFGRGSKADISDNNDPIISKINTEMKYSNERLYIRDCQSLHGTFLQVRGPIRLYKSNVSEQLAFHNMLIKIAYEPKMEKQELEVLPEMNAQSSTKI